MSTTTASKLTIEQLGDLLQPVKAAFDEQDAQDAPLDCEERPIGKLVEFSQRCADLSSDLSNLAFNTLSEVHRRA